MKRITLTIFSTFFVFAVFPQEDQTTLTEEQEQADLLDYQLSVDSIENSFTYQHGIIELKNGIGQIVIPEGFKFLDPGQAEQVLFELWGNPKTNNATLGLILPEYQGVLSDSGYVFNIQYDEIGYVKDEDADDINYNELLVEMQKDAETENQERTKEGYPPIDIVGWAAKPFYDEEKKVLHWAKEIKFGSQEVNTLNYNIRVLGRKGVIVLNAIATMPNLLLVKKDINHVLDIVQFNEGYQYKDFDPSVDQVAAWTIGGLVAGKLLTKVGFFAMLLKFWKIIALGIVGFFSALWKKIKGKSRKQKDVGANPLTNNNV